MEIEFDLNKVDILGSTKALYAYLNDFDEKALTAEDCRFVGLSYRTLKSIDDAIYWFSLSLEKTSSAFTYFYRGMSFQQKGNFQKAIGDYEAALNFDNSHETREFVLLHVTHCYVKMNELLKARERIKELRVLLEGSKEPNFDAFVVYCGGLISAKGLYDFLAS